MSRKMNDPHVQSLRYRVSHSQSVDYSRADPLVHDAPEFKVTLDKDALTVTMHAQTAYEDEARALVDPFLRAWEIQAGLDLGPGEIEFSFRSADVIDRNPSPPDRHVLCASFVEQVHLLDSATVLVSRGKYPPPPQRFISTPDVERMYDHYRRFRLGREQLLSMANFVLTMLEQGKRGQNRRAAAKRYRIAYKVLNTLGRLCSCGSPQEARKAPKGGAFEPLSEGEKHWVLTAVPRLIIRAGECAAVGAGQLPELGMADFPPLAARSGGKS